MLTAGAHRGRSLPRGAACGQSGKPRAGSHRAIREAGKKAKAGQRHLFLQGKEQLSEEQEQTRATLAAAFPALGVAWHLKEDLHTWYATATKASAAKELDAWIARVKREGPAELRKALSAFRNWRDEILAFFD